MKLKSLKNIILRDAWHYRHLSPAKAADMVYAAMDNLLAEIVQEKYGKYEDDHGDKACRCFARWISEDRKE